MSSVIVLTDSDEPTSPINEDENEYVDEINEKYDFDTISDIDLPKVPFCCMAEDSTSQSDESLFDLNVHDDPERICHKSPHIMSDSYSSEDNRVEEASQKKIASKKSKTTLKEERLKRQQTLAREKALRTIALKKSRDMKPGECIKFMEVNLDKGIDEVSFSTEIRSVLLDANIQINVTTEPIPNSVTWQRNVEESYVNEDNEVYVKRSVQAEKYIIVIWSNSETVKHVVDGTLCTSILNYKALIPDYNMTLVIFGMKKYFTYHNKSSESSRGKKRKCKSKDNRQFETYPIISRQRLEMCLTEAQIVAKCSSRLIEDAQDLALIIYQYTKSISEIPYKLQKKESIENKFEWYVMGDNRNTVRVDKDGNGLKRLWQQQLCQFNLSSLETAEAICTVYPSPMHLIEAYRNCTHEEGMNLLKDIPIRRAAGPLTAVRKVGPELSKKMYVMFTSQNGDSLLGTED